MEVLQQLKNTLHNNTLTITRKRGFEDYSREYDEKYPLTNSISMGKKTQLRKITTEAHERTLGIMMMAAKEIHIKEKSQKQNISMDINKINNSCEQNHQDDQQEQYYNTYQKPFW